MNSGWYASFSFARYRDHEVRPEPLERTLHEQRTVRRRVLLNGDMRLCDGGEKSGACEGIEYLFDIIS